MDISNSDFDVDLVAGDLPWRDASFRYIVSQQVVEHLELKYELLPFLKELRRVVAQEAEIWFSCPDMEKVCRSYVKSKGLDLYQDRIRRRPGWVERYKDNLPKQHIINEYFHQDGEHKNLYDFELLAWALKQAGFNHIQRTSESELRQRFPEFPERGDDYHSLYVVIRLNEPKRDSDKLQRRSTSL